MERDIQLIQLDESSDKDRKFILSSQVPRIIGKEEQDFKLSMSLFSKNPDTPQNLIAFGSNINYHNNSIMNINQNNSQNQMINNLSLMGQIHSTQHYGELPSPKYYELDNDLHKNAVQSLQENENCEIHPQFFSSQQALKRNDQGNKQNNTYINSLNNFNFPISSQQFDQTQQTLSNLQYRGIQSKDDEKLRVIDNDSQKKYFDSILNQRGSGSSESAQSKSRQILNSIENVKPKNEEQDQVGEFDSSKDKQLNTTKGTFSIMKMAFVKNFANKLIKRVRSVMFKKITRQQFGIIDDFASDFDYYIYQNRHIYSEVKSQFTCNPIFNFIFLKEKDKNQIIALCFGVKDAIVATLYFISKTNEGEQNWIDFLDYSIFCKIIDIPKKISEIEQRLQVSEVILNWLKLVKLECLILIIAHIASCIFIRIALSEQEQGQVSWLQHYSYDKLEIQEQYLISIYFMIITMTTTGYGDISPFSQFEKVFILIIALASQNVVGYSITTINDIVKTQGAKKKEFKQFMAEINKDMKNRNINMVLQHKISKYVEYQYIENTKKASYETNILEILPYQLKEEVLLDINKEMINNIDYLAISKLSKESQRDITLLIKQKVYFPGEIIFKYGELNDNIYYINQGNVSLSVPVKTKQDRIKSQPEMNFKTLKKQDVFGQQGFIFQNTNTYTAKTNQVTVLSYLNRKEFLFVIKRNSDDYEKYSEIQDKILFHQDYSIVKMKCYSCGETNHQLESCPFVSFRKSYVPKKEFALERRQQFKRNTRKSRVQGLNDLQKEIDSYLLKQSMDIENQSNIEQSNGISQGDLKYNVQMYQINHAEDLQEQALSQEETNEKQNERKNMRSTKQKYTYLKYNQPQSNMSTTDADLKEKTISDVQALKHTQSVEVIKNNNKLDIIKENEDENQIRNSTIPKKKPERQYTQILNLENDQTMPTLKQNISDLQYNTSQLEKFDQLLQQQQQCNLTEKLQSEKSNPKQTREFSNVSLDGLQQQQQYTNQKSKDSIQNSIDLQILNQQQQFLKNEERKFIMHETHQLNNSQFNDSFSGEKIPVLSNSKTPNRIEVGLDSSIQIEPLSGSLKKKTPQQGLLFAKQNKSRMQTIHINNPNIIPSIQFRDESCELKTERDTGIFTPQSYTVQDQLFMRRTNKSIQSISQVEDEINRRKEEKRQSTLLLQKQNDTFSTSMRNISRSSIKGKTQLFGQSDPEIIQVQPISATLPQKNGVLNNALSPTIRHDRKNQKKATIMQQDVQSVANTNKSKRDSMLTRNNTNSTYKLALKNLQPYQIDTKAQEKYSLQNFTSLNSQVAPEYLQYLSQNSSKFPPHGIIQQAHHDIKSKFKQFAQNKQDINTIMNQIKTQSMKQIPNDPDKLNLPTSELQIQTLNNIQQLQEYAPHEEIDEHIKQNIEFQIRCLKGVQNLDLLVIRKLYLLAQQKKQQIKEIGDDYLEYILVEDNEMDIDALQNFKYYFPDGNFFQIKMKIRRKETKKMKTRRSRKTQFTSIKPVITAKNLSKPLI